MQRRECWSGDLHSRHCDYYYYYEYCFYWEPLLSDFATIALLKGSVGDRRLEIYLEVD